MRSSREDGSPPVGSVPGSRRGTVARHRHTDPVFAVDNEKAARSVARRQVELDARTEACAVVDGLRGYERQAAVVAVAPDLDLDRVRAELERAPGPEARRTLLARLVQLGRLDEALAGMFALAGAELLRAVAPVASTLSGDRGGQLVYDRLNLARGPRVETRQVHPERRGVPDPLEQRGEAERAPTAPRPAVRASSAAGAERRLQRAPP